MYAAANAHPDHGSSAVRRSRLAVGLVLVALVGCAPAPSSASAPAASGSPTETQGPAGGLPPGCEPIELRGPDGSPVELDGSWIDQSRTDAAQTTWWIRTQGDCLYGVATVDEVPDEGLSMNPGTVLHYTGTILPGFTVEGPMLHLGPQPPYAPLLRIDEDVRFLIVFTDEGGVELHEDREPGVVTGGMRCVEQTFCFPPLVLVPSDQ